MNKTIISIEVQDYGDKEATIIVKGERNNQIMFEEQFDYKDEEKHPLRLYLLKGRFMRKFPKLGDSLGILCIRKLFNDITIRSEMRANPDYRTLDKEEVKQVLSELHNIARELNEPFDSANVLCEYSKRNNGYSKEVAEHIIHPIYYAPEECVK